MSSKKFLIILIALSGITIRSNAQLKNDTVKIPLANSSQIIFTMKDRNDLETLKHYNFQELFMDLLYKIEHPEDTVNSSAKVDTTNTSTTSTRSEYTREEWSSDNRDNRGNDDDEIDWEWHGNRSHRGRTWQSFNFDLGTNNYLENGSFPDNEPYAVRPWGSWYIAFNSIQRSRLGKNFFLEWGGGISWYTFKFQDNNTLVQRTDTGIEFVNDNRPERSYTKSKIGATFLNISVIPVVDFGDRSRKPRMWSGNNSAFRIGLGPYVGYRIASLSKIKYEEDGNTEKDKDRSNMYLNNIRYGARLQFGFRSTDFFFNYDINELFVSGSGPKLNAFSFGVIF